MKVSTRIRYGMRLMVNLASRTDTSPVQLRDIARAEGISLKYLSLIMIPLRARKLVLASRGMYGGYRLARPPEDITTLEVVEALDGPVFSLVECINTPAACRRRPRCPTVRFWARLSAALVDILSVTTLKDLVDSQSDHLPTTRRCPY